MSPSLRLARRASSGRQIATIAAVNARALAGLTEAERETVLALMRRVVDTQRADRAAAP